MKLRSIVASAAAFAVLCASGPRAFAADPVQTTYDAVDSFDVSYFDPYNNMLQITGVVHGESAASTRLFKFSTTGPLNDSCQRALLVVVNRPGHFSVTLGQLNSSTNLVRCTLNRLP